MAQEILTTRKAAQLLEVGVSTLKRWSDEGLIETRRTAGGHRRYARDAVERFRDRREAGGPSWGDRWIQLLVKHDDPLLICAELLLCRSRLGAWWRVADELGRVLEELGSQWERGLLSVLEEHMASERLQRALTWTYQNLPVPPRHRVCILVAAPGDDHTLGLSLAELCCREVGWSTVWVGRRTPMTDLRRSIHEGAIHMVAVSASLASTDSTLLSGHLRELTETCEPAGVELVVGGEGAWPDELSFGHRVKDFGTFHGLLERLTATSARTTR